MAVGKSVDDAMDLGDEAAEDPENWSGIGCSPGEYEWRWEQARAISLSHGRMPGGNWQRPKFPYKHLRQLAVGDDEAFYSGLEIFEVDD